MSTYQPKRGERVRVVIEGTVTRTAQPGDWASFDIATVGSHAEIVTVPPGRHIVSIERLPDPTPSWVTDGTVLFAKAHSGPWWAVQRRGGIWYWADDDGRSSASDDWWVSQVRKGDARVAHDASAAVSP